MLTEVAQTYSDVFAPEIFVLVCGLLLIGYEWRAVPDRSLATLGARVATLGVGWAVAFLVYQGVPRLVAHPPTWAPDATGSAGLGLGVLLIWAVWRRRRWGTLVPGFAALLVGVTVPHLLVTPFWDVSSHVLYAVVPAGYLGLVDWRFAPLSALALGMVVARPLAGAHTWLQSIGGLLLGVVFLWAAVRVWFPDRLSMPAAAA
ncbi:hypothetical protein ACFQHP_03435 [Halomicroarcula sp. GCM10025743]|uniref:hypothetical protein n=1 Tax=Halomicroarcula sp. GCM10025743 TaxID=3252671 RepID=UPI00360FDD5F